MPRKRATVFGGTGFLGHRIVEELLSRDLEVRVAVRRPERVRAPKGAAGRVAPFRADVRDGPSAAAAVDGAQAVVNAVGLYVERGGATFRAIHVEGARRVAEAAHRGGAQKLVHISGIGADPGAPSPYVRCRGEGEAAVRHAFERATIFRPSVMFGPDDAFLNALASLARRLPALPLFGRGRTRLQPVFAGDVARAAARALDDEPAPARLYELGGPQVYTYRELLELVLRRSGRRRLLVPVPFAVWELLAAAAGVLPAPPLTEGQVALMKRDNVPAPDLPGLEDLGVAPTPIEAALDGEGAPTGPAG